MFLSIHSNKHTQSHNGLLTDQDEGAALFTKHPVYTYHDQIELTNKYLAEFPFSMFFFFIGILYLLPSKTEKL